MELIIKTLDLDPSEADDLDRLVNEAARCGGYLRVQVIKNVSADIGTGQEATVGV